MPTSILPNPLAIEPEVKAPVVTISDPPALRAYVLAAEADDNLESKSVLILLVTPDNWFILVLVTPVTPLRILSSVAVELTLASLFISAAVALISLPPIFNDVAESFPVTLVGLDIATESVANVTVDSWPVYPIPAPSTTKLSTTNLPPVTVSVVVMFEAVFIAPNPLPIAPPVSVPVSTILLDPAIGA